MSDIWRYLKEPAGMGEWCYGIYYYHSRMAYCADEWQASQMVRTLNKGEKCTCR